MATRRSLVRLARQLTVIFSELIQVSPNSSMPLLKEVIPNVAVLCSLVFQNVNHIPANVVPAEFTGDYGFRGTIEQGILWREGVGIEPTNDGYTAAYRF